MFRAKTIIVLGAGASAEVGLPMGAGLLDHIVKLTHIQFELSRQAQGDEEILRALRIYLGEQRDKAVMNAHISAGRQLSQSAKQALSIDNVIDALEDPQVELIGKMGIIRAIWMAEETSRYFKRMDNVPDTLDLSRFSETWYSSLTKLLTEGVKKSGLDYIFENLSIINFNYDRCIEHYLPFSLANYYGLSVAATQSIMASLTMYRPYGSVGRLPWQAGDAPSVPFGGGSVKQLAEIVQQVRTFTESVADGDELSAMKNAIAEADRIVFLGFAFHRQNVELISQATGGHTEVVATAYMISRSDKDVISRELATAFEFQGLFSDKRITLADLTCADFFKEYWRTLTAERSYDEPVEMPRAPELPNLGFPFPRGR